MCCACCTQTHCAVVVCCLQDKVDATYKDKAKWARMSIMMTAGAGKFSTDRTIAEYAKEIWNVKPCVVPQPEN